MNDYHKIPFNRIKDIEEYLIKKLNKGHFIIQILVEKSKEHVIIHELIAWCKDRYALSSLSHLTKNWSWEEREERVIRLYEERMGTGFPEDINISLYSGNPLGYEEEWGFLHDFGKMKEYYNGKIWNSEEIIDQGSEEVINPSHYEFYISKKAGDILRFEKRVSIDFPLEYQAKKPS